MSNKLNILSCRVCLTTDQIKVTMNSGNGWIKLFEYCFGLQINPEEEAKTLCEECAGSIKCFALFKEKCLKSNAIWKSHENLSKDKDFIIVKTKHNPDDLEESDNKLTIFNKQFQSESIEDNWSCSQEPLPCLTRTLYINGSQENLNKTNSFADDIKNIDKINIIAKDGLLCKCGSRFKKKSNYKLHIKKCKANRFYRTQSVDPENCGLCEFSIPDGDVCLLVKHFDDHYMRNDLQCSLCDYTARDFAEMVYHRYTHQKTKTEFYCLKCYGLFHKAKSLQFHFRTVHLKKKGGLCTFCNLSLATVRSWNKHEMRKHSNEIDGAASKLFICDCCGLKFVYRNEIVTHLQQRAGFYKVVCDKCGEMFRRKGNLRSHYRNKHTKPNIIKCPNCPKTMNSYLLKNHIDIWHTEEKYICEICSRKLRTKANLQYHMLTHANEKPFKCDRCDMAFRGKSLLTVHKLRHTGIKPYECSICFKRFLKPQELRRHNLIHSKERPVNCEQCDRSFYTKKLMIEHAAKTHSGVKLERKEIEKKLV